jgi:hypothetical protein
MSPERLISPSPSRSHCTSAPVTNTLPSSAYSIAAEVCAAHVVSRPWHDAIACVPVCRSMKQPVP